MDGFFRRGFKTMLFAIPVLVGALFWFVGYVASRTGVNPLLVVLLPLFLPVFFIACIPQLVAIFPLLSARSLPTWVIGLFVFVGFNVIWRWWLPTALGQWGKGDVGDFVIDLALWTAVGMFLSAQVGAMILSERAARRRRSKI